MILVPKGFDFTTCSLAELEAKGTRIEVRGEFEEDSKTEPFKIPEEKVYTFENKSKYIGNPKRNYRSNQ